MRNKNKLLIDQLDRKLGEFKKIEGINVPPSGWINNIRTTLNMTLKQLGEKINITKQGVKKIEEREVSGTISINSLREVGDALEMRFFYGFIPKTESVNGLIDMKAKKMASKIVLRTNQNMKLENQGNKDEIIKEAIDELASEIKRKMLKTLWD